MRFHLRERCGESFDLIVAVMKIVNDAHVWRLEGFDDRELIFRFTKPTAMIVKADFATDRGGGVGDGPQARDFGFDAFLLLFCRFGRLAAAHDPELWVQIFSF